MITPRLYQANTISLARKRIAAGIKRLLIVGPTGCGKTSIFAIIVEAALTRGSRVLVNAHRRELVRQAWVRFVRAGINPDHIGVVLSGVESGPTRHIDIASVDDDQLWRAYARRRPGAPVQVASIDSIRNRAKPEADIVIIDESHRVLSASYLKLAEEYPTAIFLGLTATPLRADGRPLGNFFEDMIVVATYRELAAHDPPYLVEPRVFTVPAQELPDLSRVRIKGSDYDTEQLSQACDQTGIVGNIVDHWLRHGNNAPTFCFAVNVEHSKHITERFKEAGVPAVHVDAQTPTRERDAALAALRSGAVRVFCNVDIAAEGIDVPIVKTIVLARPTRSLRVFLQQVGRGSRPCDSGLPFVVLDHTGSVLEHGLPQCIEFTPDILHATRQRSSSVSMAPVRTCPACFAVLPAATLVCPECQHEFVAAPRAQPEEHDGELVEVRAPTVEEMRQDWGRLCTECVEKGHKPGWVWVRWGELHPGTKPPEGCRAPEREVVTEVNVEQLADLESRTRTALDHGWKFGKVKMDYKSRWHRYPSMTMFKQTQAAREVTAYCMVVPWLMGLAVRAAVVSREPELADTPVEYESVANDVELIDVAV